MSNPIDKLTLHERIEFQRRFRIKMKARRKQSLLANCSMQAKYAKAKSILMGKGRNGMSMNDAMVAAHGIQRKAQP